MSSISNPSEEPSRLIKKHHNSTSDFPKTTVTLHTPIRSINWDILWYILGIIVEENEDKWDSEAFEEKTGALDSIRNASQVCRAWRSNIISASGIWGKLLNLNALNQKNGHWRNTVLDRSEKSCLWIRACIGKTTANQNCENWTEQFLFLLLEKHFSRIERLAVYSETLELAHWDAAKQPAPLLRRFNVKVGANRYYDPWIAVPIISPLFNNVAPLLEKLSIINFIQLPKPLPNWISNLRELTLGHCVAYSELSNCLRAMPYIRSLCLQGSLYADNFKPSRISLPHLRKLIICGIFTNYVPFIVNLDPRPGCSFAFNVKHNQNMPIEGLFKIQRWLYQIFQSYIRLHCPRSFHITLVKEQFFLRDVFLEKDTPLFQIDAFGYDANEPQDYLVPFYLQVTKNLNSFQVEDLKLRLDFRGRMEDHIAERFRIFASGFDTITTLRISEYSIDILLKTYPEDAHKLFPQAQTLSINFLMNDATNYKRCGGQRLEDYLDKRKNEGFRFRKLELANLKTGGDDAFVKDYDLRALERFSNLLVRWNVDGESIEYSCGSGRPETLRYHNCTMHWSGSLP